MISPVKEERRRRKKPGHPFTFEKGNKRISGPKSYKEYSNYQKVVEDVLAKPEARKVIYNHLLKSGLLQMHIVSNVMKALYIAKENDKEAAWNITQSSKPPNIVPQSKFEEGFVLHVREVQNAHDDEKLKEKAELRAKSHKKP
jgi:hypothetical protein